MPRPSQKAAPDAIPAPITDLARLAFDSAGRIAGATSFAELESAMRPAAEALGFADFVLIQVLNDVISVVVGAPQNPYYALDRAARRQDSDAIHQAARQTTDSFFYSEVRASRFSVSNVEESLAIRASYGIHEGFLSARHRQNGVETYAVLTGAEVDAANRDVRAATHMLAETYATAARRLLAAAPVKAQPLTQRQRDCLQWVGRGKSSSDIADILGLSPHTVHAHVSDACARLGVRTRVQAVAVAISLGLLES